MSYALGGSLEAKGFGDGKCRKSHPQAALEAATLPVCQIEFDRLLRLSENLSPSYSILQNNPPNSAHFAGFRESALVKAQRPDNDKVEHLSIFSPASPT
jgi:hypothetical protein